MTPPAPNTQVATGGGPKTRSSVSEALEVIARGDTIEEARQHALNEAGAITCRNVYPDLTTSKGDLGFRLVAARYERNASDDAEWYVTGTFDFSLLDGTECDEQ